MSIEVLDESGRDLDVRHLASLSRFVMDRMRVHPLAELCIKAVDEETIAGLNAQWMDKEGVTDVLARALELGATAIIMVHNHPSGDPTPSADDIAMTREVSEAAEKLGISLHDHIVIGSKGHVSLKSQGLI